MVVSRRRIVAGGEWLRMLEQMYSTDWISHHVKRNPHGIACFDVFSNRTLSYAEFDDRIARLATALKEQLGVSGGERVLVLSRNDIDVFEIQFACHRASALFVPLNWRLSTVELQEIAKDAAASVLFFATEFRGVAERIASTIAIGRATELRGGVYSEYEALIGRASVKRREALRRHDDIWALLYTSGTTGKPKAAQITFSMALCNAMTLGQQFRISDESVNLVALPTFHTAGLNVFANPIFFFGGTNVVVRDFEPEGIVDLVNKRDGGITHMMGVPTTHAMLLETPGFERIGRRLREVCVAGAPCPAPVLEAYARIGLCLRQCWGMTEVGPLALFMPRKAVRKLDSCGLPGIFAKLKIVDVDGNEVPAGETGELLVKGPVVTSGYWQRPEANALAFDRDGWFRTGDAVRCDDDGYFYIVDRWKDMYISGGENIYPAEIESTLSRFDGISECAVVGIPDERWGEVGRAFIVSRRADPIDREALREHCEQHLARYKIPKEFVLVDTLPRNASGKVLKAKLKLHAMRGSEADVVTDK